MAAVATQCFGMFSIMRKRSKLTLLVTCAVLLLDRAEGVTSKVEAVAVPLHQQITLLEAKYETLEAATEQFRVRASSLSKDLEEEKYRCDRLERSISKDEQRNKDEISSWRDHLDTADAKFSSMETEYQNLLRDEKAKTSYLEQELVLKDIEISDLKQQMAVLQTSLQNRSEQIEEAVVLTVAIDENKKQEHHITDSTHDTSIRLETISSTPQLEESPEYMKKLVSGSKSIFVLVRQCFQWLWDVVAPQAQQYGWKFANFIREAFSGFIRNFQKIQNTGKRITDVAKECFQGLRDHAAPKVQHYCWQLTKIICEESSRCFWNMKMFLSWLVEHAKSCFCGLKEALRQVCISGIRIVLIPIVRLLSIVGDFISATFSRTSDLLWHVLSAHLNDSQISAFFKVLRSLQAAHQLFVAVFEALAVAGSSYFMTRLSGTHDHWFYKTCLAAKLNSGPILVMLEVVAGLAFMELALATLHRTRGIQGQDSAKARGHQIAVSIGKKPSQSASLLRSAGGLSFSDSNSSSKSYYSLNLD